MELSIGEVARRANVTVRTLHHYDEVGLLRPSGRAANGYRVYDDADLERLVRIREWRALGFALDEIPALLDGAPRDALIRQAAELDARIDQLQCIREAVRRRLGGGHMSNDERLGVFADLPLDDWDSEARERWAQTDAYKESVRRTATYTAEDWRRVRGEGEAVRAALGEAMRAGAQPGTSAAWEVAEAHRLHIDRWIYPCPPEMHERLARTYVADDRFRATYDAVEPGLADWLLEVVTHPPR